MVRPLLGAVSELASCVQLDGRINEFLATQLLRREGALKSLPNEAAQRTARMREIAEAVQAFSQVVRRDNMTVRDVLAPLIGSNILEADHRLLAAFNDQTPPPELPAVKSAEPQEDQRKRGWHRLFASPWQQVARYKRYLEGDAPISTHQVVKGSEFEHVMVVMDDHDAAGFLFAYDKIFGGTPLSPRDRENASAGSETSVDRTLRLLYVTCSRAQESLCLILWAQDPAAAMARIRQLGWFEAAEIKAMPPI
jgi:DNA helicase-2/ATP-dependent DNA helicase PcrA